MAARSGAAIGDAIREAIDRGERRQGFIEEPVHEAALAELLALVEAVEMLRRVAQWVPVGGSAADDRVALDALLARFNFEEDA